MPTDTKPTLHIRTDWADGTCQNEADSLDFVLKFIETWKEKAEQASETDEIPDLTISLIPLDWEKASDDDEKAIIIELNRRLAHRGTAYPRSDNPDRHDSSIDLVDTHMVEKFRSGAIGLSRAVPVSERSSYAATQIGHMVEKHDETFAVRLSALRSSKAPFPREVLSTAIGEGLTIHKVRSDGDKVDEFGVSRESLMKHLRAVAYEGSGVRTTLVIRPSTIDESVLRPLANGLCTSTRIDRTCRGFTLNGGLLEVETIQLPQPDGDIPFQLKVWTTLRGVNKLAELVSEYGGESVWVVRRAT